MSNNLSFENWEKINFEYILELYNILEYHLDNKLDLNFSSVNFLNKFSYFLYINSYKDKYLYELNNNINGDIEKEYENYRKLLGR